MTAEVDSERLVLRRAKDCRTVHQIDAAIAQCRACPRLVSWREQVAREKRASFRQDDYWGRPVPAFGADDPRILIVGLAPGAHGANRTGRMFTGDRSGDWLFGALHRAGLAQLPTSTSCDDGQRLRGTRITAAVHCAPPDNKPLTEEKATCAHWLERELALLVPNLRVIVALGGLAWQSTLSALVAIGSEVPKPRPRFGHGVRAVVAGAEHGIDVLGSYHPSQQNTFTGRLTEVMLDDVFQQAAAIGGIGAKGPGARDART